MQTMKTKNCIICGKRATNWCGHVRGRQKMALGNYIPVEVLAGFCDKHTESMLTGLLESDENGCYGDYDTEIMGVCVPFKFTDNKTENIKKQWQGEVSFKIKVYADNEEEAKEQVKQLAESIRKSNDCITDADMPRGCNMLDDYGNELPSYYSIHTRKFEYYTPLCPFGNTDCILDENYENCANITHLRSFSGKPCEGCVDGSLYDDENK